MLPLWLDERQRGQLAIYRDLLLDWNQRVNLTAITDPIEVERRLFLDALRMVPAIDEFGVRRSAFGVSGAEFARSGSDPNEAGQILRTPSSELRTRLVDVGSGAGFPGVVLKIARPELAVTLVEGTGKKVRFLQHVIGALGLAEVEAIHGRAEELGHDSRYRETFELATARAVASLPALLELCVPFLRVGGRALFPKSVDLGKELAEGERAAPLVGARIVRAQLLQDETCDGAPVTRLVIADKIGATPPIYPRRAGIPARDPLGRIAP